MPIFSQCDSYHWTSTCFHAPFLLQHLQKSTFWEHVAGKMMCFHAPFLVQYLRNSTFWEPVPGKMMCFHPPFLVQHLRNNTFWEPVCGKKYILFLDPSTEAENTPSGCTVILNEPCVTSDVPRRACTNASS